MIRFQHCEYRRLRNERPSIDVEARVREFLRWRVVEHQACLHLVGSKFLADRRQDVVADLVSTRPLFTLAESPVDRDVGGDRDRATREQIRPEDFREPVRRSLSRTAVILVSGKDSGGRGSSNESPRPVFAPRGARGALERFE